MTRISIDRSNRQLRSDPAANYSDHIDSTFASAVPGWHRAFDGGPHVTEEAVERLAADLASAARRGVSA